MSAITEVQSAITDLVVYVKNGTGVADAGGIDFNFPYYYGSTSYLSAETHFTTWVTFVKKYC
jgi:hypothetical protein